MISTVCRHSCIAVVCFRQCADQSVERRGGYSKAPRVARTSGGYLAHQSVTLNDAMQGEMFKHIINETSIRMVAINVAGMLMNTISPSSPLLSPLPS